MRDINFICTVSTLIL